MITIILVLLVLSIAILGRSNVKDEASCETRKESYIIGIFLATILGAIMWAQLIDKRNASTINEPLDTVNTEQQS